MNKKNKINKPVKSALATQVSLRTKMLLVAVMLISFSVGLAFFGALVKTFLEDKQVEVKPGTTYTATVTLKDKTQNNQINWSVVEQEINTKLKSDKLTSDKVYQEYSTIINSKAWMEYKKFIDKNGINNSELFEGYIKDNKLEDFGDWVCKNRRCGVVGVGRCGNVCLGGKLNIGSGEWELKLVKTF